MTMRGTILHAPGDVRYEERPDPTLVEPTDAIVRAVAVCVCGSDLWPYRGIDAVNEPRAIGHEYCGVVEQVGSAVTTLQPGQFVVGGSDTPTTPARFAAPDSSSTASTAAASTAASPS
jgi:threonine dehydrogenase-like Zn-dependent dehydrogenase